MKIALTLSTGKAIEKGHNYISAEGTEISEDSDA